MTPNQVPHIDKKIPKPIAIAFIAGAALAGAAFTIALMARLG